VHFKLRIKNTDKLTKIKSTVINKVDLEKHHPGEKEVFWQKVGNEIYTLAKIMREFQAESKVDSIATSGNFSLHCKPNEAA